MRALRFLVAAACVALLAACSSTSTSPVVAPTVLTPHLSKSEPVRLQVPVIGVDANLMKLGLDPDGTMSVPPGAFPAGWYVFSPTPGEIGPSVISGHVDYNGPGVFQQLHLLKAGDMVTVTRQDGSTPQFKVTRVLTVPKAQFPSSVVYGPIGYAGLRLVTCGGPFDSSTGHYVDNVIVFTTLVG
jgi:sortase (surface protein transpeptidase)